MKKLLLLLLALSVIENVHAQADSLPRTFKKIDIFPAISYSPETKLTLGAIGYYYFDMAKKSTATKISNISFLAAYTTANQVVIEGYWDMFADGNLWRSRGETFFNRYPDRDYGRGNDAGLLVVDIEDDEIDTLNYLRFDSDRIKFAPVALRRMSENFYLGMQLDLDYLYRMRLIPDEHFLITDPSHSSLNYPVEALNIGLGINALYDSRDNIINPLAGSYIEFSNHFYSSIFGSEYDFSSFLLDTRQYVNTYKNHTLALRALINLRFSEDPIPLRGLSRVGGHKFIRGYYKGTYQDKHMVALELEYRCPFWKGDVDAPTWKIWKRLGIVGFISSSQVMHEIDDFSPHRFNMAAGAGIRILFNADSKLNIRIDYGVGLNKDSDGPGKRQSGLYFFLAEAF